MTHATVFRLCDLYDDLNLISREMVLLLVFCIICGVAVAHGERDPILGASTVAPRTCEGSSMFHCGAGRCIPYTWICDGDNDCEDNSDEVDCHLRKCLEGQMSCRDSNKCIPNRWKCDGDNDCEHADDEDGCENEECRLDQFNCGYRMINSVNRTQCIPATWKCDGQKDCPDEKDEAHCPPDQQWIPQILQGNSSDNSSCLPHEFRCDNGQCIFARWKCDFDEDCTDGSDENHNCTVQCDPATHFKCAVHSPCILKGWVCDGEADCPDHSDETHCTEFKNLHPKQNCGENQFACKSGECIHKAWKCDGDSDCADMSDEKDCGKSAACNHNQFTCKNESSPSRCIDLNAKCDGMQDCMDGSDELGCPTVVYPCNNATEFACSVNKCIGIEKVCDGHADCMKSQRGVAAKDETKEVCKEFTDKRQFKGDCTDSNGKCQHKCHTLAFGGRYCACHQGYVGNEDSTKCTDIDECSEAGMCSQLCHNTPGSYFCTCHKHYLLQNDQITCRAIGANPLLLLSNRVNIRTIDLITNEYTPVVDQLDSAVAMDYLFAERTIIWSDVATEKIMLCKLAEIPPSKSDVPDVVVANHSECQSVLVENGISTADGLAVDWVHKLLFWTDTGLNQINVMSLQDKKHRVKLIYSGLDEPRAIAADPKAGLIFWTDWGTKPKIEKAGMDGTGRKTIIETEIAWPNGLAVDLQAQRIYWADAKLKMICYSGYDGDNRAVVLQSWATLKHPFSISVFEEKVYWTDWDTEGVHSANKFHGHDVKTVVGGMFGPMTVKVYHSQTQPDLPNKCLNHDCEHLCLPHPHKTVLPNTGTAHVPFTCQCSDTFLMGADQKSCRKIGGNPSPPRTDSERESQPSGVGAPKRHGGAVLALGILCIVSLLVLVIGYMVYKRRMLPHGQLLNFDNPVYRRTVHANDPEMDSVVGNDYLQFRDDPDTEEGLYDPQGGTVHINGQSNQKQPLHEQL